MTCLDAETYTRTVPTLFSLRICAIGCLVAFSSSFAAGQVAADNFIVGVLQANGIIVPVATYDGTRWTNSWPGPVRRPTTPPAPLEQVPREWLAGESLVPTWRLWLPAGSTHVIRVLGLQYSKTECTEIWGLTTDFPASLNVRPNSCPDPVIGIVLNTDRPVEPILPADISRLPFAALERAFAESENREISASIERFPSWFVGPTDEDTRAAIPIRVERAWRTTLSSGDVLYYIEANRSYAKPAAAQDSACPSVSAFRGWIARDIGQEERVIDARVELTDCDFKTADTTTPTGLLQLEDGNYVIARVNGWESQSYQILKIESGGVIPLLESPLR